MTELFGGSRSCDGKNSADKGQKHEDAAYPSRVHDGPVAAPPPQPPAFTVIRGPAVPVATAQEPAVTPNGPIDILI
ncbi:hypothetical protein EN829_046000, partial [Mesorhizobium sp. M00.F.Ca.ET.186.01.1.1]